MAGAHGIGDSAAEYESRWSDAYTPLAFGGTDFGILNGCGWLRRMWDRGKVAIVCNALNASSRNHTHGLVVLEHGDRTLGPNDSEGSGWGGRLAACCRRTRTRAHGDSESLLLWTESCGRPQSRQLEHDRRARHAGPYPVSSRPGNGLQRGAHQPQPESLLRSDAHRNASRFGISSLCRRRAHPARARRAYRRAACHRSPCRPSSRRSTTASSRS
jgi:hypothetical protein